MTWYKVHVFNYETPIGSFYTDELKREKVTKEINEKYGVGKWTRYTLED